MSLRGLRVSGLEFFKVISVNTIHATTRDLEQVGASGSVTFAASYDYGTFVYCGGGDDGDVLERMAEEDFSEEFIDLIEWACSIGCTYICFDCSGGIYDELPKFQW